jgi:hypothetical protein
MKRSLLVLLSLLFISSADAKTLIISNTTPVSTNLSIASTIVVQVENGGMLDIDAGKTLTIAGPTSFPLSQVFTGTGAVSFSKLDSVTVEWFGASASEGVDNYSAIAKAVAAVPATGGELYFSNPGGIYETSQMIDLGGDIGRRVYVKGATIDTTVKAQTDFSGTCILSFGNRTAETTTLHTGLSDLTLDSNNSTVKGFEVYGVRDGSSFKNIYLKNFTGTAVSFKAAGNSNVAAGHMNEGVHIESVIAFSTLNITGAIFELDALFESTIITSKALGRSDATNNATGFKLGGTVECRGVSLIQCSVGNLAGGTNYGIHYAGKTRDCWDNMSTFENIKSTGVLFDGIVDSGQTYPVNCMTLNPRLYNVGTAEVLSPAVKFLTASSCLVDRINYYNSEKTAVEFGTGSINCYGMVNAALEPSVMLTKHILFTAGSQNRVSGYTRNTGGLKQFFFHSDNNGGIYLPNGTELASDVYWTTFKAGTGDKFRFRNNSNTTILSMGSSINTYTDNAAALAAEIPVGGLYRTSTGVLMIRY